MNDFNQLSDEAIIKKLWDRPVDPRFFGWVNRNKPHLIGQADFLARSLSH